MMKCIAPAFNERLMCHPVDLDYDFWYRTGRLRLYDNDCTDMTGCIKFFQAIDPAVEHITTWNASGDEVRYEKSGETWIALEMAKPAKVSQ